MSALPSGRVLSPRMVRVLEVLAEARRPMTANEIGRAVGAPSSRRVKGPWAGPQAPSQQVVPCITGLRRRGLVSFGPRPDGQSGSADRITAAGRAALRMAKS